MNKTERLKELILRFGCGNNYAFAKLMGVSAATVSMWLTRGAYNIELVYERCEGISAKWLLSGEGCMMEEDEAKTRKDNDTLRKMVEVLEDNLRSKDEIIALQKRMLEKDGRDSAPKDGTPLA